MSPLLKVAALAYLVVGGWHTGIATALVAAHTRNTGRHPGLVWSCGFYVLVLFFWPVAYLLPGRGPRR